MLGEPLGRARRGHNICQIVFGDSCRIRPVACMQSCSVVALTGIKCSHFVEVMSCFSLAVACCQVVWKHAWRSSDLRWQLGNGHQGLHLFILLQINITDRLNSSKQNSFRTRVFCSQKVYSYITCTGSDKDQTPASNSSCTVPPGMALNFGAKFERPEVLLEWRFSTDEARLVSPSSSFR